MRITSATLTGAHLSKWTPPAFVEQSVTTHPILGQVCASSARLQTRTVPLTLTFQNFAEATNSEAIKPKLGSVLNPLGSCDYPKSGLGGEKYRRRPVHITIDPAADTKEAFRNILASTDAYDQLLLINPPASPPKNEAFAEMLACTVAYQTLLSESSSTLGRILLKHEFNETLLPIALEWPAFPRLVKELPRWRLASFGPLTNAEKLSCAVPRRSASTTKDKVYLGTIHAADIKNGRVDREAVYTRFVCRTLENITGLQNFVPVVERDIRLLTEHTSQCVHGVLSHGVAMKEDLLVVEKGGPTIKKKGNRHSSIKLVRFGDVPRDVNGEIVMMRVGEKHATHSGICGACQKGYPAWNDTRTFFSNKPFVSIKAGGTTTIYDPGFATIKNISLSKPLVVPEWKCLSAEVRKINGRPADMPRHFINWGAARRQNRVRCYWMPGLVPCAWISNRVRRSEHLHFKQPITVPFGPVERWMSSTLKCRLLIGEGLITGYEAAVSDDSFDLLFSNDKHVLPRELQVKGVSFPTGPLSAEQVRPYIRSNCFTRAQQNNFYQPIPFSEYASASEKSSRKWSPCYGRKWGVKPTSEEKSRWCSTCVDYREQVHECQPPTVSEPLVWNYNYYQTARAIWKNRQLFLKEVKDREQVRLSYVAEFERGNDPHVFLSPAFLRREFGLAEFYDFPQMRLVDESTYDAEDLLEDVETDEDTSEDVVRGGRRVNTSSSTDNTVESTWEKNERIDRNAGDNRAGSVFYSLRPWRHKSSTITKCFFCGTHFAARLNTKWCPLSRCSKRYSEAWQENEARTKKENQCQPQFTEHQELQQELSL